LVRDLEAYQRGRPVLAGTVTPAVRLRRARRFLRLHMRALAVAAAVLVASVGVVRTSASLGDRSAERAARDLVTRSLRARSAAWGAIRSGEERLRLLAVRDAAEHARLANVELTHAAAYLERSWRALPRDGADPLQPAVDAKPLPEEVRRGLLLDPVLAALRARTDALRGRALAATLQPATAEEAADCLERSFEAAGDLADVEALLNLAAAHGEATLIARAASLLERTAGVDLATSEDGPRLLRLRVALADLQPGEDPRALWSAHSDGPIADVAAELEAAWRLERGDVAGAAAALTPQNRSDHARLVRARIARAQGDWTTHGALIAPLIDRKSVLGTHAALEHAAGLIGQARSLRALDHLESLRGRGLPPALDGRAALLEDRARRLAGRPKPELLWQIMHDPVATLNARLDAARQALLDNPNATIPDLSGRALVGEATRRRHALRAGRHRAAVAQAVGRVALRRLDLPPGLEEVTFGVADDLRTSAKALGRSDLLAAAAILFLDRGEPARALDLVADASGAAVETLRRLASNDPFRILDATPRATPNGLWEGRAALVAYAADPAQTLARATATRALNLAVRSDPFHTAARLARSRLNLLLAGDAALRRSARRARLRALGDAAAACAADPGAPEAWSLLFQAIWVNHRARWARRSASELPRWSRASARGLRAHEIAILPQLAALEPEDAGKPHPVERETGAQEAGFRLLTELARAQREDRDEWRPLFNVETQVVAKLETELTDRAPSLATALLRATLAFESPADLERLFLEPLELDPADSLEGVISARGAREAEARLLRIVRMLKALKADAPAATRPGILALCRRDLEAIARRTLRPGVLALRALLEVWAGRLGLADLPDLLTWRWEPPRAGGLYDVLSELAAGRPLSPEASESPLFTLPAFAPLVAQAR
jgi:hypothetical protein